MWRIPPAGSRGLISSEVCVFFNRQGYGVSELTTIIAPSLFVRRVIRAGCSTAFAAMFPVTIITLSTFAIVGRRPRVWLAGQRDA